MPLALQEAVGQGARSAPAGPEPGLKIEHLRKPVIQVMPGTSGARPDLGRRQLAWPRRAFRRLWKAP